ncbi:group III truncated hemoglobin [Sulfurovum sp.]|uniref:group III truncated hemoglobin n=1 Tax=Sulfurovum sp. TaxID=1969726 RepID=UPI00356A4641
MTIELENTINDENIERLVRTFYPSVLEDEMVGPFFIEKLGSDISSAKWEEHLVLLSQFWAFTILGDEAYTGHPLAPHFEIEGISREAFNQWLKLFYDAVDKIYTENIGEFFKTKSADIAENFMRKLEI